MIIIIIIIIIFCSIISRMSLSLVGVFFKYQTKRALETHDDLAAVVQTRVHAGQAAAPDCHQ